LVEKISTSFALIPKEPFEFYANNIKSKRLSKFNLILATSKLIAIDPYLSSTSYLDPIQISMAIRSNLALVRSTQKLHINTPYYTVMHTYIPHVGIDSY
jgi:hypothetical protein